MSSTLSTSALGAFEGSLSVLLTLFYGVIAASAGMLHPGTAKDISKLCRTLFLPALLLTSVGNQLSAHTFTAYIPIFVWSIVYTLVSLILGKLAAYFLGLPKWTVAAIAFNNTTSFPLLLTKSLTATRILTSIVRGDVNEAAERAQGYFLINSLVSNVATFSFGPKLLEEKEEKVSGEDVSAEEDVDEQEGEIDTVLRDSEPDEETSLLPKPITSSIATVHDSTSEQFHRLPRRIQSTLKYISSFLTPTLWGAILAIVVGVTPPLHRLMFFKAEDGGVLNPWLTSSLRNIGDLFTALQMFVVGYDLSISLTSSASVRNPNPRPRTFITIFTIRFLFWGLISPPLIYLLATRTTLLSDDPMLWWSMMLMPSGPPAMVLSTLIESMRMNRVRQDDKMVVARTLMYMYIITPIMCLAVVGALRACEMILDIKGQRPNST